MRSLNLFEDIADGVSGAADAVGGVVNFWSDPFGNMYKAGREATIGLSRDVIPAITESTLPNLSMPSFLNTYAVSFALSMMLAVLLLMFQFVRVARGRMSGQDLFESIGMYFPGFILGVSFGPAFGILLIELMRWLTRGIIDWAYGGTVEEMVATFSTLAADDPARITGGAAIGSMVMWAMAIGMLVIPLIFVFQLVVQYFMGVLIPLAVVWIVDAGRRASGLAAVQLWVGMLVIQPLLFLLLGFAFRLNIDAVGQWGNDGFKNLAGLLVAVIAIGLAVFAPFVLIGWAKKHLAGAPASDSTLTRPLGPSAPANVRHTPPRSVPQTSTPQAVRSAARPADAQGAVATKIGPQTAGATGRGRAATATSSRAGASAASGAGTKAVGATAAGAAVAVKGAETVARKSSETAHMTVTPPPVHGKERPE